MKRKILLHATIRGLVLLPSREGGPHISSYLYMAAKRECVSPTLNFSAPFARSRQSKDFRRHQSWIVGFCWGETRLWLLREWGAVHGLGNRSDRCV